MEPTLTSRLDLEPILRGLYPEEETTLRAPTVAETSRFTPGIEDASDILMNFTDPMQAKQLGMLGAKGLAKALPLMIGAFESRPLLRGTLANIVEKIAGPAAQRRFAKRIVDAPPESSYSELIDALGLKGKPELQGTHGFEWEALSQTPPLMLKEKSGPAYFPWQEGNTSGTWLNDVLGQSVLPFAPTEEVPLRRNPLLPRHDYSFEIVTPPYHGEAGVAEWNKLGKRLQTDWRGEPLVVGGPSAGGHINSSHPSMFSDDAVNMDYVQALLRTVGEDVSPTWYPLTRAGQKGRYSNAIPWLDEVRTEVQRETKGRAPWNYYGELLGKKSEDLMWPGKEAEVNMENLFMAPTLKERRVEFRAPRSPQTYGEATENMTVAEAALQEAARRTGTQEGVFPDTPIEYAKEMLWPALAPRVDEITAFRMGQGNRAADPYLKRKLLEPQTWGVE